MNWIRRHPNQIVVCESTRAWDRIWIVVRAFSKALDRIRNALHRVTSSGRFIPTVDGLRFVAILAVVMYHLNDYAVAKAIPSVAAEAKASQLHRILACGGCGVSLFFVISGFILGCPFAEHYLRGASKPSLSRYYQRRILRIEPPYVINMLVAFVLLIVVLHADAFALIPHLVASLLYMHNFVYREMSAINCVAWSLEVEVQFYVLAPFLATLFAIRGVLARRAVLVGIVLLWAGMKLASGSHRIQPLGTSILDYLDFFLCGFLLADVYVASWNGKPTLSIWWDIVGMIGWAAIVAAHFHETALRFLPLVIFVAYVGAFRGTVLSRFFSLPWIATIGGMCYTIYLYHFFLISAIGRWTINLSTSASYWSHIALQAAIILPSVLAISAVLFLWLEKPFMVRDWPDRCRIALQAAWRNV